MNFQITPYCEDKEENEDSPKQQKFFAGTNFVLDKHDRYQLN